MKCFRTGIAVLLTAVLLFSMTACGNTPADESSALSAGGAFAEYVGLWSESDLSFEKGGFILKITIADDTMTVHCSSYSSLPDSKVAELSKSIELSQIKNNVAKFSYDEDGWGNSGVLELTFSGEYILADFKNVVMDEMANWGFYEKTYKLVPNAKAYEILAGSNGDVDTDIAVSDPSYEDEPSDDGYTDAPMYTFPDYDTPNYDTPTYDTSKASGILASMGMTEEEFKASCTPLWGGIWVYSSVNKFCVAAGKQYYDEHPDDEDLQEEIKFWNELDSYPSFKKYYQDKYSSLEEYLSCELYQDKGIDILDENTVNLFKKMEEYPNNYVGQHFVLVSPKGYAYDFVHTSEEYSGSTVRMQDFRDDIHNPNILSDKEYLCYAIFTGSDGTVLNFDLIAIEDTGRW